MDEIVPILTKYIQALGVILPTVALALGFFPQIWEFHKLRTGQAYSSMLACLDISGCVFGMAAWILQGQDAAGLFSYIVIIFLQLFMLFLKHVWYAVCPSGWEGDSERGREVSQVTLVCGGNPKSLPLAGCDHIQLVYDSRHKGDVGEGCWGGGGLAGIHVDSTINRCSSSRSSSNAGMATTSSSTKCIVGVMAVAKDGSIYTTVTHAQQ